MLRIRQLRERKGVSLRELARRADVGVATLSRIESGEANPRLSTLLQLADALGVLSARKNKGEWGDPFTSRQLAESHFSLEAVSRSLIEMLEAAASK